MIKFNLDTFRGKVCYQAPKKESWTGRPSNPAIGNQYWHQEIQLTNLMSIGAQTNIDIALIGYACDAGVQRNLGRIGAVGGPEELRERLAKLPIHFYHKTVVDVGNVVCLDQQMEVAQTMYAQALSVLIERGIFPIAIGGGHDMAYGSYKGIKEGLAAINKPGRVGIINFDAHFDLRPVEELPNSGTPFNQLINEYKKQGETIDYFAIGIQRQSNTKELFEIAEKHGVSYALSDECESYSAAIHGLQERLKLFVANNDYLYITIDMDGFSSAFAPGVSAPSPLGFTPHFVYKMLRFLFETKKVIACDIAELNPSFDHDRLTANLAAKLVDFMVMIR
ncbi:formimidoylglutamase [Flavobacteriaceae bacterium F08102]|nr:formimidoylglutamase [Flavobacteriaceae bacterium F08102]